MQKKLALSAALGVVALTAGLYLSGYLTVWLLKLDTSSLQWNTYWTYWRALDHPQVAPCSGKIKLGGAIGFGVPVLAYLALLVVLFKPKDKTLHGEARFATASDLARKGLFTPSGNGIVVGKFGSKLVRLGGQQFVILAAPTRSGKGVGVVIPNLLEYADSVVVLDIKQENFDLTSGWRQSQGQKVFLFNPFAEDRRTHRWNPLSYVSPDPAFRISDLQAIAAMLYPDAGEAQKFWVSQARNAFMAFALYLFEGLDARHRQQPPSQALQFPTLGQLFRLSSGDGSDLKAYLRTLAQKDYLSDHARTAFAGLLSQAEETFASIMGTFKEPLNPWINPVLDAATSANDFLLTDVRKQRMTIYIGIQPNKLAEARLIVNLFFSQLINVNTKELPQNNPQLKHQCLLLMDEFTAIGKVDIIANAVSYMAGYNLRLLPIIQSMAQLDAVYGQDVSRTLITNHALQILYAPREQRDANDYSEMLGYRTVRKRNVTRGREVSHSESEERRALMLPQELKAMGFDKEVFLYEGIEHPVLCEKIKYYQDKHFTARLLPKAEVPTLDMGEGMKLSQRIATAAMAASVAACAQAPTVAAAPASATTTVAAPADSAQIKPKFTAEQALGNLLELIRGLRNANELTPERLTQAFGLELKLFKDGDYGASETLTPQWRYGIYADPNAKGGTHFEFDFRPRPDGSSPPMTGICGLDFDQFSTELKAMGYLRLPDYGIHGSIQGYRFRRPGLLITVPIRGEASEPTELIGHDCVESVRIKNVPVEDYCNAVAFAEGSGEFSEPPELFMRHCLAPPK